jgi:hypothetical protein
MSFDSQIYESFIPVYEAIPEKWEEAREILVEVIKQITNSSNIREIGWYLDTQLLTGKSFIPSVLSNTNPDEFRQIFRKVVIIGAVASGVMKSVAHGIIFDINFTLIQLWASATDSMGFNAVTITGNNVTMNAMNINVTSPISADRCFAVIEYLLEI